MPFEPGSPTLDQLRVFLAVVDVGSFAGAARKLGRATSVVSYSIANLEAQLGVELFDRETTRKPQLTEAGSTDWSEARAAQEASTVSSPKSEASWRCWSRKSTSSWMSCCRPHA